MEVLTRIYLAYAVGTNRQGRHVPTGIGTDGAAIPCCLERDESHLPAA